MASKRHGTSGHTTSQKWIAKAVPENHTGVFTAKAKAAGEGVQEYAHEKADAPGKLGKEARLALTFAKMAKH